MKSHPKNFLHKHEADVSVCRLVPKESNDTFLWMCLAVDNLCLTSYWC